MTTRLKLGRPLEIHDLGETEIDEGTYWEYIDEMRGHYTAEKVRVTPPATISNRLVANPLICFNSIISWSLTATASQTMLLVS